MRLVAHITCGLMLCIGSNAWAQRGSGYFPPLPIAGPVAFELYKAQLRKLREEALMLQAADGGKLSTENNRAIQRRIDHIEDVLHRRLEQRGWFRIGPQMPLLAQAENTESYTAKPD